jgi:uroporphyrinogen-III synthase
MNKTVVSKTLVQPKEIKKILVTQPKPESDKSPWYELTRKYSVELEFQPFIRLEAINAKEFRRQKIEIQNYTGLSSPAVMPSIIFFRMCEEMKVSISQDTKYFCITEAVALYLQKFILYRKRKVFYGTDGTNKSMFDSINKHKGNEKFMYVCSENQQDNEIVNWLKSNNCEYVLAFMYRTQSNDVKELITKTNFDVICFFTPSGVKSLFDNLPKYKQNGTLIGAFGSNTVKAVEEAGLKLEIRAPQPLVPSMVSALDQYLSAQLKKK